MKQERTIRKRAIKALERLACAPVNDAVKLAFLADSDGVEGLELSALAEFKRTDKGGVEVRLIDRAAVLRELVVLGERRSEERAEAFFQALEEEKP